MTARMTDDQAQAVKERAGGVCQRCWGHSGQEIHHRQGKGMGGTSKPDVHAAYNLVFLCRPCHSGLHLAVGDERDAAILDGFLVSRYDNPAEVPVLWAAGGWLSRRFVLLTADGGVAEWEGQA